MKETNSSRVPPPAPSVQEYLTMTKALEELNANIGDLHAALDRANNRFSDLTEAPPLSGDTVSMPLRSSAPHVARVETLTHQLRHAIERLDTLISTFRG